MTRPAGTTPKGLPYPGSADIHARTPTAIQALAEAIDSKLTSLGSGIMLDLYQGVLPVSNMINWGTVTIPFPNLAAVQGYIAIPGIDSGGQDILGYFAGGYDSGFGQFYPIPGVGSGHGPIPSTLTVHAIGWGTPRA
jgi:hypothetical protein